MQPQSLTLLNVRLQQLVSDKTRRFPLYLHLLLNVFAFPIAGNRQLVVGHFIKNARRELQKPDAERLNLTPQLRRCALLYSPPL